MKIEVNLHGMTLDEAVMVAEGAVNIAIVEQKAYVLYLIHGIGEGILKEKLHEMLLNYSNVIDTFYLDPMNPGVTRVYF